MKKNCHHGPRSRARDLIVQSLYQIQITGQTAQEVKIQFRERPNYEFADKDYFEEALISICDSWDSLEKDMINFLDRPIAQLDPVEKSILLLGFYELNHNSDVPFKVVINESIELAKRFGALDSHKYINAILDRVAEKF